MNHTILRLKDVQERVKLSRSSIYAKVSTNQFPSPIKLGKRASGWLEAEVDDWLAQKIESSRD